MAAFETRNLNVFVAAQIDDGDVHEVHTVTPIPPGYDAMDVRAVTVRKIEDAAFALTRRDFNRAPTLQALVAAVARVRGIQEALDETVSADAAGLTYLRIRIRQIIDMSNDEATVLFGEDPEGI